MTDFICIYKTLDSFEANLIKSRLESADIFCAINSNDASGTLPYLQFLEGGIEILVHKDDLKSAQEIIQEMKE